MHARGAVPHKTSGNDISSCTYAAPLGGRWTPAVELLTDRIGLQSVLLPLFIKSILKSLVIPAIRLVLSGAVYSRIAVFFVLNHISFSANENGTVKQNNHRDFSNEWNFWKMNEKKTLCREFCNYYCQNFVVFLEKKLTNSINRNVWIKLMGSFKLNTCF